SRLEGVKNGVSSFFEQRTDIAPRSSGKENQLNVKPFIGTLRVTNPVRQSGTSSRKRVLRGGGRLPLRSVDSEIKRCAIEPRNLLVLSLRLCQTRGPSQATNSWSTQACLVTPGSEEHGE